jgi:hypothetical protein
MVAQSGPSLVLAIFFFKKKQREEENDYNVQSILYQQSNTSVSGINILHM